MDQAADTVLTLASELESMATTDKHDRLRQAVRFLRHQKDVIERMPERITEAHARGVEQGRREGLEEAAKHCESMQTLAGDSEENRVLRRTAFLLRKMLAPPEGSGT